MLRKGSLTATTVTSPVDSKAALMTSLPIRPNPLIPSVVVIVDELELLSESVDFMQLRLQNIEL